MNIEQVVITHYHEDHTGNASYLQKTLGVPLYMNQGMIESCKTKADYPWYRKFFWGKRKPFIANPIGDSFTSKRATWNVIKTPGHSRDHLSFLNNETGQLFTGDIFVNEKVKVILQEEHIPDTIESLQKILTYDFKEVFCNHAGHLSDGYHSLKTKLNHLTELQDRILHLYHEGRSSDEINQILFPRKYPITKLSLGEWDSLHIVESVINHEAKENAYQAR